MSMQHEALLPLSNQQLEACHGKIALGYPDAADKLQLTPERWQEIAANGFVLPIGPWTVDNHFKRRNPEPGAVIEPLYTADNPMSQEAINTWTRIGLRHDTATGLPIHPRAEQLLTTPGLGMFTQVGSFYGPGPNAVANVGLSRLRHGIREYAAVAVNRGVGGLRWSLPGGFVDRGRDADLTMGAFRETREEIDIKLGEIIGLVLRGYEDEPQYTWAATVDAWMQEAYFFAESREDPCLEGFEDLIPEDRSEIVATAWLSHVEMANPDLHFMGTHRGMIHQHEAVVKAMRT